MEALKKKPIRVLHVLGGLTLGGAESRIMDIYRNLDRSALQFDFLVHNNKEDYYNEEIRGLGGNVYRAPRFTFVNMLAYRKWMRAFFEQHKEFRAVHGHMTSTASLYLPIAKKSGVAITIAHARSAGTDPGIKGTLVKRLRSRLYRKTDYCFACSALAGEAVFGKKRVELGMVQIIPNAIEVKRYVFSPSRREQIRKELGVGHQFVIGHVGRFHYAKNHAFLITVFEEIKKKQPDAVLLLLGEGELMSKMKEKVRNLGLSDSVIFAGNHANVEDYYQAMDYFVFPSHFEGLPGSVVEAQACGLKCLIADTVTKEVAVTELVSMKSLQESASDWAAQVLETRDYTRKDYTAELRDKGFDVQTQIEELNKLYLGASERYHA